MQSKAKTVKEYLIALPSDRRKAIEMVRKIIKKNLPKGYQEIMQYGMISYVVPLRLYPDGYLNDPKVPLPYASLASQKNYMSLYLMNVYGNQDIESWFKKEFEKHGKNLNMGKSCVRFKKLDDINLDVIGKVLAKTSVQDFTKIYEAFRKK